jgi:UDP-glucose 4-epimerase
MATLITGGAGFIGSHLVEALFHSGEEIIVVDNFSTGSMSNFSREISQQIHFLNYSLDDSQLQSALSKYSIEKIYHLAAVVGVAKVMEDPEQMYAHNSKLSKNILKISIAHDSKVFVASSSEVYGNANVPFLSENMSHVSKTTSKRWLYGKAKREEEEIIIKAGNESNIRGVVGRLFNTVGPRQLGFYGMVLPRFIQAALGNLNLKVYGDGSQVRTFLHVKDCVKAMQLVTNSASKKVDVYNIGGEEPISILSLAEMVISALNSNSSIEFLDPKEIYGLDFEDIQKRIPNCHKIKSHFGWQPAYNLKEIILDMAKYESGNLRCN